MSVIHTAEVAVLSDRVDRLEEQARDFKYAMVFLLIWVMAMAVVQALVFIH